MGRGAARVPCANAPQCKGLARAKHSEGMAIESCRQERGPKMWGPHAGAVGGVGADSWSHTTPSDLHPYRQRVGVVRRSEDIAWECARWATL